MPDNEGQQTFERVPATISGTPQVIHEVVQQQADTKVLFAPFGVDDKNVQMYRVIRDGNSDTEECVPSGTLRDFYQEWLAFQKVWQDFIQNADFVKFSSTEPTAKGHVELWYDGDYSESTQSQG